MACFGVALTSPSWGCLWDSDTVADELRGLPDVVDVVTGRFDRNPQLFYQLRLKRVSAALQTSPRSLSLYDDAAVACDRLGDDDSALAWMARKRNAGAADNEALYRTLANEGTFYAHKWIRSGRSPKQISLLKKSIADLNAAVKLNPEAHFGREAVQVRIIEWYAKRIQAAGSGDLAGSLHAYLLKTLTKDQVRKGICGLVVLGSAWESPDAFSALSWTFAGEHGSTTRFIWDRVHELSPNVSQSDMAPGSAVPEILPSVDASYQRLRAAADAEADRRTAFMMERLRAGRHPDTDPKFWDGWTPKPRPDFVDPPFLLRYQNPLLGAVLIVVVPALLLWLRDQNRKMRAR